MSQPWEVLPGGLSDADHASIQQLAEKGWKSSRIAQRLKKNSGTVYWYMLRNGLVEREATRVQTPAQPYKRGGHWVYPYSAEEDAFIEALRVQDYSFKKIAEIATKRFGKPRNHHSIFVRLTILAAAS
jgi:hypothetical protein